MADIRRPSKQLDDGKAAAQILGLETGAHELAESLPDLVAEAMRISLKASRCLVTATLVICSALIALATASDTGLPSTT